MAPVQQPAHRKRACTISVSWNNREKGSHLSSPAPYPFQDEQQQITTCFCPATSRDETVRQSYQQQFSPGFKSSVGHTHSSHNIPPHLGPLTITVPSPLPTAISVSVELPFVFTEINTRVLRNDNNKMSRRLETTQAR